MQWYVFQNNVMQLTGLNEKNVALKMENIVVL